MTLATRWRAASVAFLILTPALVVGALYADTAPSLDGGASAFLDTPDGLGDLHGVFLGAGITPRPIVAHWSTVEGTGAFDRAVLFPDGPLSPAQSRAIEDMLRDGTDVWLADPEGHTNGWLFGQGIGVATPLILDPSSEDPNRTFLHDPDGAERVLARTPSSLLILDEQAGWSPVLVSTPEARRDVDDNGSVDLSDPPGPFLVAVKRTGPPGTDLVVFADRSLFLDDQISFPGNDASAFLQNGLAPGDQVAVDEVGSGPLQRERLPFSTVSAASAASEVPAWFSAVILFLVLAGVVFAIRRRPPVVPYTSHQSDDPVELPTNSNGVDKA